MTAHSFRLRRRAPRPLLRPRIRCRPSWPVAALLAAAAAAQPVSRAEVAHVLRRTSFGPTPSQLASITTNAQLVAHLRAQLLAPGSGYSPPGQAVMNLFAAAGRTEPLTLTGHGWTVADLQVKQVALALVSDYQLREVLTRFWEEHFSTHLAKVRIGAQGSEEKAIYYEWLENDGFRARALGTFLDLLRWSMDGPAMRFYLDSVNNCAHPSRSFNENYAREVLELHTVGPGDAANPHYSNDVDIPEVTRILSGMLVNNATGSSYSLPLCHDFGPKTVFAASPVPTFSYPGTSQQTVTNMEAEIDAFRRHLVATRQTAAFVSGKLIRYFVGDHQPPDPGLLQSCISAWGPTGDLQAVLSVIFSSPLFRTPNPQWTRVDLPLEALVGHARILDGSLAGPATLAELHGRLTAIVDALRSTGAAPFEFPSPDGYPLASQRQIGTAVVWQYGEYAYRVYSDAVGATDPAQNLVYDPVALLQAEVARLGYSFANADHVAEAALLLQFQSRHSPEDLRGAKIFLQAVSTTGVPSRWNPVAADADNRVRLMTAFVNTLPQASEK